MLLLVDRDVAALQLLVQLDVELKRAAQVLILIKRVSGFVRVVSIRVRTATFFELLIPFF